MHKVCFDIGSGSKKKMSEHNYGK